MKREFLVLALLGALLGYLVYDSMRDDPSKVPVLFKAAKEEDAVPISRDQVARVELIRDNYIVVLEKGRNGKFAVKSPVSADIDQEVLDKLFAVFEKMEIKKTLRQDTEEIPLIMSEYGLATPGIVWRLLNATQEENTFLVGKETPGRDGFYAKWKDREEILVLPKALFPSLNLDARALRDKEIFSGLTDDAVREIVYGKLRFLKGKDGWRMVSPHELACDREKMEGFIDALRRLRAQDFVGGEEKTDRLPPAGDAAASLTVVTAGEKVKDITQQIRFGGNVEGNKELMVVYKGAVGCVIARDLVKAFPQTVRAFADARIVPFEKAAVDRITVGENEGAFTLVKKDGRWEAEGAPQTAVDNDKVTKLAEKLTAPDLTDVLSFTEEGAAKAKLLPPEYTLKINDKLTVALSSRSGDAVYFLRDDLKNMIGQSARGVQEFLSHDLTFYRDKNLLAIAPDTVTKVSLTTAEGKEIVVERTGSEWFVTSPVKGKIAEGAVQRVLLPFENLRAIDFVPAGNDTAAACGLDAPPVQVKIWHAGKEDALSVGKQKSPLLHYAALRGLDGVFLLNRKTVKQWEVDLLKHVYLVETDSNHDTIVDSWTYFDKGRKTKMEIDVNNDGAPDVVSNFIYNADGSLAKVETDNNEDGKVDQTTYFVNGVLEREESDADYNGVIDSVTHYKNGRQYKSDIDVTGDGKPDVVKYYLFNEKGEVTGADVDRDLDGKTDTRERYEKGKIVKEAVPVPPSAGGGAVQSPVPEKTLPAISLPPKTTQQKSKEFEL